MACMPIQGNRTLIIFLLLSFVCSCCVALSKYSKEANLPDDTENWRNVDKPFRLAKVNLVWAKAQKRLSDAKLKTLYSELKVQDKEELQLKRLKADNLDKDGLKEAELRRKFGTIIERYGLAEHFGDDPVAQFEYDKTTHHNIFKDKKLQRLWDKAEKAGFTETELKTLREEFVHHQEKVDQFYNILESRNSQKLRENNVMLNEVHLEDLQQLEEKLKVDEDNVMTDIRETNRNLKQGYDRLERMALSGPKSKEFEEPKVQGLWRIAQKADFTQDELESLRTELRHYEQRLQKLRYLQAQHALKNKDSSDNQSKSDDTNDLNKRIKLQSHKVDKLHADLETRITRRHLEL